MEPGTLAKVLHDFLTTVDGELSLCKGEYFLVHSVVDKHWCYGQSREKMGKFPTNHLHKVELPQISQKQKLFISIAAFHGEQPDDLSFAQGEIIVGTQEVGSGWYLGEINDRKGIFPATHTWAIDTSFIKKAIEIKTIRKKARVKTTLKAQLDEELDLTEGEIVTVTEVLGDGWCQGLTADGRTGTFPEGFISYIEDDIPDEIDTSSVLPSATANETVFKDFDEGTYHHSYNEEPAPYYYDLFPELRSCPPKNSEHIQPDANLNSFDIKPYAITLYPFNAQFPNELSFGVEEVVHLIKHIDTEWIEGMIDGVKGIFPSSYVNIIVDCPEIKHDQSLFEQEENSVQRDRLNPGTQMKVEYTFKAQMDGDLSVIEDDTVIVVEMANADWVSVKNKDGEIGLCPRGYLSPFSEASTESVHDLLEDFVVIRDDKSDSAKSEGHKPKRLSEPHRPAPPAPAPGRVPLQKESNAPKEIHRNTNESNEIASHNATDVKQKKADQRQNVISELVLTEKEYVRDLKLTYETFQLYDPNFLESRGIDVATLFGNILEVIHVAEELLDMILKAMKGCDENLQTVGPCFIKMAEKMQTVYVKYCGSHEAALALLKKYENNEEIMAVFNKGTETLRYQIACFDMSSILIKPVQRILKYPLILYELIKCTEDDHPDKLSTEEAWKTMTDVASYINEYKRRKDLVSKYLDSDNTLIRKMAKLNMHSVAKMSMRLSTRLSASLGLTNVAVDSEFEDIERQFRSVEKCTLQLAKDVEQCVNYLNDEAISGDVMSDFLIQYYQGEKNIDVKRLRDIRSIIWSQFIKDLKLCLDKRVSTPVNFLANLLEGPAVLITKRHDKLLDYDAAISKSEKYKESKIVQDELAMAKSNFEALSHQLLEELPILIDAATKILINCINAFANARKLLSAKITKRYLTLCENSTQLSRQDVLESFLVNHNLLWNQITRFAFAGANPRIEEDQSTWCPQSERQRISLRNKYSNDKLYVVTDNIVSTSSLDMGAAKGTLVAVIKKQDPMGDTTRWYVDNGVAQGFLPSNKLQQIRPVQQVRQQNSQQSRQSQLSRESSVNQSSTPDLMSLDSPEKEVKSTYESNLQTLLYLNIDEELGKTNHNHNNLEEVSKTQQYQNLNYSFYYAMYDFPGNMPGTLPIVRGQVLRLVRPHDEKGNGTWWHVENRYGQMGYVPQNYLSPFPVAKQ